MKPTQPAEELYPAPQDEVQSEEQFDAAPVNFDDDGEDPLKRHTKFSWKSSFPARAAEAAGKIPIASSTACVRSRGT